MIIKEIVKDMFSDKALYIYTDTKLKTVIVSENDNLCKTDKTINRYAK